MVNPFDRTFFRFAFGFTLILGISFAVLFFVNRYSVNLDNQDMSISQNSLQARN